MSSIARGLEGIVLTETRLSEIDGDGGRLTIAGFPVEELAPRASFEEVLHLLWYDRLPGAGELAQLRERLALLRVLPPSVLDAVRATARARLEPMEALRTTTAALALADGTPGDEGDAATLDRALALCARLPVLVAAHWRLLHGRRVVAPRAELGHAANYLYMLSGELPPPAAARGVETYLNTVVDHGMNASTFTARVITSTRSDLVSAIVGAIGALKGPAHGGAPGPALDMVFDIRERAARSGASLDDEAEAWTREAIAAGARLMGFGHRVYKVRDPRADVLDRVADELFQDAGDRRLYDDARAIEKVALRVLADMKPGRRVQTNVEFYTALVLHGAGLPPALFTPTFAIARTGGWIAHVLEQRAENRLIRPRVAYTGARGREWEAIEARG
jgi:citrate synthase